MTYETNLAPIFLLYDEELVLWIRIIPPAVVSREPILRFLSLCSDSGSVL
jgi:hypothetical protein